MPPCPRWLACLAACSLWALPVRSGECDGKPWAFLPPERPSIPGIEDPSADIARNPIDAFLLETLREHAIEPAGEADRRTLIRRLTFDLIGLPPTPEDVEAFERDTRPDAYERLVDRLLASPHHGERWGRHWLDVVRFAETHGYERDDPKPNAWKYRDYVISAFNADKAYDRFLTEQLAGDELPESTSEAKIATGLHRLGPIDDEPADSVMDRFDQLDDMVRTVGTAFMGLTIHCARCHDHKFDPISQQDYYRMVSFFSPGRKFVRDSEASISLDLADPAEIRRRDEMVASIDRQVNALRERLTALPPADPATSPTKREIEGRIAALEKSKPVGLPRALGLTDAGPSAEPTHVLVRGDAHKPGKEVVPAFLSAIDRETPAILPASTGASTGRRTALARWLTAPDHPLTPRVIANRLWAHHFGAGIVASPSDFGAMGDEPTHPELLDWLASELASSGWSLKAMHRMIVSSAAYRRATAWNDSAGATDPENTLLWRRRPRRLEAESLRDAILAVSGALNPTMEGPSIMPPIDPAVLAGQSRPGSGWKVSNPVDASRRSVYIFVKRTLALPELEVMDSPENNEPCPRRSVTTTAPQALTMFNSAFAFDSAARFADRLRREARDESAHIDRAFKLAYGRAPTSAEKSASLEFLDRQASLVSRQPAHDAPVDFRHQAMQTFCLVILNSNEFLTVD
jgi:hypothetical protein